MTTEPRAGPPDPSLHVQPEHDLPHRRLGTAVALDVGAAGRDRQMLRQHDGERLEHQGVARRPAIDLLAVLERDPGEQAEAKPARSQCRLELVFFLRPILSERPYVGVSGIVPSLPAQLVMGCVQHVIRSKFC